MKIEEKLQDLIDFVQENDNIRAMVLQGSYVNPNVTLDVFSDLDPLFYVTDLDSMIKDESWILKFGTPITRFSDSFPAIHTHPSYTRLVIYDDGFKLDFGLAHISDAPYANRMPLYKVIIDKDKCIPRPEITDDRKFYVEKPTNEVFNQILSEFFFDTSYIIKSIYRKEYFFTEYMFGILLKKIKMITTWYIGVLHDFKVNVGLEGRYFKNYLTDLEWHELNDCFTTKKTYIEALHNSIAYIQKYGPIIASKLEFKYPKKLEVDVIEYIKNKEKLLD